MSEATAHPLRVEELTETGAHHAAADLLRRIWRTGADQILDTSTITAFAHTGNYVAGAYRGEELIGFCAGFFAADGHLHSHITGVAPGRQGGGVGYALKQHQRVWALERGVAAVCWTFDPLVGRNAYFNLHRLGARATAYLPDFYGPLGDGVNSGDATDRLYITWELASPRATAAATGDRLDVDTAGARPLLDRDGDAPGEVAPVHTPRALVATPPDIDRLRATGPEAARRWRYAVREALTGALAAGYRIMGITRDGRYLLERS